MSSEIKRVLIAGFTSQCGGMESFVMNIYRHINTSKIQFDFIDTLKNGRIAFAEEIEKLGGRIYKIPRIRDNPIKHYSELKNVISNNNYISIYMHANNKPKNIDIFKIAKQNNVLYRIIHSHNTNSLDHSIFNSLRNKNFTAQMDEFINYRFACSEEAGKWMFGDRTFTVVNNTIDTSKFDFNVKSRIDTRNSLVMDNQYVLGTVGRLSLEKNPFFMVDCFESFHKKLPNSTFIHVGDGSLKSELSDYIKNKSLSDSYLLLGNKTNVSDYLNAMDLFLLPSKHEGFPISLVEAQATGLRCIVADNITRQTNITGNEYFLPIDDAEKWATLAEQIINYERKSEIDSIIKHRYDNHSIIAFYNNLWNIDD